MTSYSGSGQRHAKALIFATVTAIIGSGCQEPGTNVPSTTPEFAEELNAALTPSAHAALSRDGTFRVNVVDKTAGPQLSESQAVQLARVFGRAYAVHSRSYLELQHKAPIAFDRLEPCGRAMYASSPYSVPSGSPKYVRNVVSPRWFITLCNAGIPTLSIAVAAAATELRTHASRDRIEFPDPHGNEFLAQGIPSGWQGALAVSAEQAAIIAHRATGHRVDQAPRLTIVDPAWIPQAAQWVIHLDQEVQVPQGEPTRRIFVGLRLDGVPAIGSAAVVAQVQRPPIPTSVTDAGPVSEHLSIVTQTSEFGFGWKTAFLPIR